MFTRDFVDGVTVGYISCAEWLLHDELALAEALSAKGDVEDFLEHEEVAAAVKELVENRGASASQIGHDFFLTRNRHGAGFWDRGYGEIGEKLTKLAHRWGETYYEGVQAGDFDEDSEYGEDYE